MKKVKLTNALSDKISLTAQALKELHYSGVDLAEHKSKKLIAIVGTRKPTAYGRQVTREFAEYFARKGIVVVSGLAIGVDSLAHEATLKAGGQAIAVLPSGLEAIYPATNRPLADRIIKSYGTLLSEYGANHKPRKVEFLERNRIIAAISDLVFIPEAAAYSGSLNTAAHAHACNTPVAVVPGHVTAPMSAGTNYLLKTGKALAVVAPQDCLELLGINDENQSQQLALDLQGNTPEETLLLQKIALGFSDAALLLSESKLQPAEFQIHLSMLEIQGRISRDDQDNWRLC